MSLNLPVQGSILGFSPEVGKNAATGKLPDESSWLDELVYMLDTCGDKLEKSAMWGKQSQNAHFLTNSAQKCAFSNNIFGMNKFKIPTRGKDIGVEVASVQGAAEGSQPEADKKLLLNDSIQWLKQRRLIVEGEERVLKAE